jgi:hypothetical protein
VDPFLAAELEHRALVVLAPEAAARLHPAFEGELGWEKLLTMAMARQLHRRIAGSNAAMGPPWFREGFAAAMAGLPMKPWSDFTPSEMQSILKGAGSLEPQACALLFRHVWNGNPLPEVLDLPTKNPVTVDLDPAGMKGDQ